MFLDEARLAGRVRHPNVVQTLDVVALDGELFLVMDYVHGESLGRLVNACRDAKQPVPLPVLSAVLSGALHGLHAAHEATSENGEALHIVHRDMSPQNILVGLDGVARVLDFGVAKAAGRTQTTREGQIKGKLAYMAPETLLGRPIDRRADLYAAGVVLWEALTLRRLFTGDSEGAVVGNVISGKIDLPSVVAGPSVQALDEVTMRALHRSPDKRFESAREMALALEGCGPMASVTRVTEWVEGLARDVLGQRAEALARIESDSGDPSLRSFTVLDAVEPTTSRDEALALGVDNLLAAAQPSTRVRRARVAAGLASGVVLAALTAFALIATRQKPHPGPVTMSAVGEPSPAPEVVASSSDSVPVLTAPPASVAAPAPAPESSTRSARGRPRTSPRPAASAGSKPECAIRSYVDESGITYFVKDCP
jgi:serine/threonine-protein kinase